MSGGPLGFALGAGAAVLVCALALVALRGWISRRAERRFAARRDEQVAADARVARRHSEAVIRGQVVEHLLPVFDRPTFACPADARFLGQPVDFIVFDGHAEARAGRSARLAEVVFVDVKTGRAQLSRIERRIRDCVEAGRVRAVLLEMGAPEEDGPGPVADRTGP